MVWMLAVVMVVKKVKRSNKYHTDKVGDFITALKRYFYQHASKAVSQELKLPSALAPVFTF